MSSLISILNKNFQLSEVLQENQVLLVKFFLFSDALKFQKVIDLLCSNIEDQYEIKVVIK